MWQYANNHPILFLVFSFIIVIGVASIVRDVCDIFKNNKKGDK